MNDITQIKRGDIWYVDKSVYTGSEQQAGRPAVVVSNNKNNEYSTTVEVVFLTTKPKKELPTHVLIYNGGRESTVLCEQVTTVAIERLSSCRGRVSSSELMAIDNAIRISLDLSEESAPGDSSSALMKRLTRVEIECGMLRQMYDRLLDKILKL